MRNPNDDHAAVWREIELAIRDKEVFSTGFRPVLPGCIDPTLRVVNIRRIDDIDLSALNMRLFDGEHWEDAAKAFLQSRLTTPPASARP